MEKSLIDDISNTLDFFLQLDGLKLVNRRTYINSGERLENSAEHSWQLAMACWAFAELLEEEYDTEKLLKLALIHDVGEIEAGDTFLFSEHRHDAHINERKCVEKLAAHPGNPIGDMLDLWEEQETGDNKEVRLLKVVDRLLPFLHNIKSEGRAWTDHGVQKSQVLKMNEFINNDFPEIHQWFLLKVELAVENGWLGAS